MQTVQSAIEQFRASDEYASKAKATRKRHDAFLRQLIEAAGPTLPVARLTRLEIDKALNSARAGGCLPSSLNAYKSTSRILGRWLLSVGYVKLDPAAHLRNTKAKTPKAKRKPLTAEQLRTMFQLAEDKHPLDWVTLMLLAYTSCRESEIVGLMWQDVDFDEQTINVWRPKVQDYHTTPMTPELLGVLKVWRDWVETRYGGVKPDQLVVPARAQKGWHRQGGVIVPHRITPDSPLALDHPQTRVREMVQEYMQTAKVEHIKGRGTHTIRRTAANLLLEATGDIRAVQHLLGHSSVSMTERYLDIDATAAKYNKVIRDWSI